MASANASAKLYSLLQTCIAHGIDGYQYLRELLVALPRAKAVGRCCRGASRPSAVDARGGGQGPPWQTRSIMLRARAAMARLDDRLCMISIQALLRNVRTLFQMRSEVGDVEPLGRGRTGNGPSPGRRDKHAIDWAPRVDARADVRYYISTRAPCLPQGETMNVHTRHLLIAAVLLVAALGAQAQAVVIYDTFGPGTTYDSQNGWIVGHTTDGANYASYSQFSPTLSGFLSTAMAPIRYEGGEVAPLRFEVRSNDAGHPGDLLALTLVDITEQGGVVSGSFLSGVLLSSQSTYWFGMATTDPTTAVVWNQNSVGVSGEHAFTGAIWQQPGEWLVQNATLGAFQVVAIAIPEPSNALLLALGLILLGLRRRAARTSRT